MKDFLRVEYCLTGLMLANYFTKNCMGLCL